MKTGKISRRGFISGGALLTMGMLGAGVVGCTNSSASSGGASAGGQASEQWDREVDVVIVGSGFAGQCAAIETAQADCETMIIEKAGLPGGNSILCGGGAQFGGGTSVQIAAGITDDTPERFFNDIYRYGHYRAVPELLQAFVNRSVEFVDWIQDLGLKFTGVKKQEGMSIDCSCVVAPGDYPGISGISWWTVMNNKVVELGVETVLNTKATSIILDEEGNAIGVAAESEGSVHRYKARKAVILASGSWKANVAMRTTWDPRIDEDFSAGGLPYVESYGEMVQAAVDAGAGVRDMSFVCEYRFKWGSKVYQSWNPPALDTVPDPVTGMVISNYNDVVVVQNQGKRLIDENKIKTYPQDDFYEAYLNLKDRPRAVWAIVDAKGAAASKWDIAAFDNPSVDVSPYLDKSCAVTAGSIEDLAKMMGVPEDSLKAEIDRYNGFVTSGMDEDFGKTALANPLSKSPYYAVKLQFFAHDQMGGICTNSSAQVLKRSEHAGPVPIAVDEQAAIPHLYAAGECVGGYVGAERGHGKIGMYMVYGRIAGQAAAKEPTLA